MFVSHDVRQHVVLIDTPIALTEWEEREETGASHEQITVKALKLCSCNAVMFPLYRLYHSVYCSVVP
jgi:hypothetical protein